MARLRAALLAAPYGLCTSKAELLTDWFRAHAPRDRLAEAVARAHFTVARRALARSFGRGAPQASWQLAANTALQRFYLRREDALRREPPVLQYAHALAHVLAHSELRIYDDELIVGNLSSQRIGAPIHPDLGGLLMLPELATLAARPVNPLAVSAAQRHRLEREIFPFWFSRSVLARAPLEASDPALQNTLVSGRRFVLTQIAGISHVTPDYAAVVEKGFAGLLADALTARRTARDDAARAFLDAAAIAARAAIDFGERWGRHCEAEAARCSDNVRAAELRALASVFAQVPARPARTFHEALQSVFTAHVIVHQESFQHGVSFGRLDRLLQPYYERDLAAGRITRDGAVELLACFLGKAAELLPLFNAMATEYFSGLSSASGITLGGTDAEGRDAACETSFLLLDAYDQMRLRQPNLHLRVHPGSDPALLARAHEVVKGGGGMPALFNDAAIVPALERAGVPPADARDYSIVGCVEWGVPGRSFPAAGAAFVSLPAALERALHALREPASIEAVFAAFAAEVERTVAEAAVGNDAIERAHARHRPTPLLSLLVQGCVESGVEVNAGGARYDSTGMQGVGVADVADSLAALEQVVFAERRIPFAALRDAIDRDFAGAAELAERLAERVPKYGEDRGAAERWARRVAALWCEAVARHRNPRGGAYAPGFWTMTTHVGFGRRLGALPSGRRAGRALADGLSPVNGCDREGPTASLMAAVRATPPDVTNGLCVNEKLDDWLVRGASGTRLMEALTRAYFAAGGMHVQYNVVDPAVLLDARTHPERHRGLVVRISRYSAYFCDLTPEMQDDIIARTLHGAPAAAGPACQDGGAR
ncbi:MAG TPA: pyruvate formate lyase family protein [Myxococcota bacterium]|nr:pyruvate formate lyase family protein [Myxococcota bacterium]